MAGIGGVMNMMGMNDPYMMQQLQFGMGGSTGMGGYPGMMGGYPGVGGGFPSMGGYPGMGGGATYPNMGAGFGGGGNDLDTLLGYGENKEEYSVEEFKTIFSPVLGKGEDAIEEYQDKITSTIATLEEEIEGGQLDQQSYYTKTDQLRRLQNRNEVVEKLLETDGALDLLLGNDGILSTADFARVAKRDGGDPEGNANTISFITDLNEDYDAPKQYKSGNFSIQEIATILGATEPDEDFSIYSDELSDLDPQEFNFEDLENLAYDEQIRLNEMELDLEDDPDAHSIQAIIDQRRKVEVLDFLSDDGNFEVIANANEANNYNDRKLEPVITLAEIAEVMKAGDADKSNMTGLTSGDVSTFKKDQFKAPKQDDKYEAAPVLDLVFGGAQTIGLNKVELEAKFDELVGMLDSAADADEYDVIQEALYFLEVILDQDWSTGSAFSQQVLTNEGNFSLYLSRTEVENTLLSGKYIELEDWV